VPALELCTICPGVGLLYKYLHSCLRRPSLTHSHVTSDCLWSEQSASRPGSTRKQIKNPNSNVIITKFRKACLP
jgi:hypothetical protein